MYPTLRLFVACWNSTSDPPPPTLLDYRLRDIKSLVLPSFGEEYPLYMPEACFFALMTGGRRAYEFVIRVRYGVGPDSRVVWESAPGRIDLGVDPLTVRALPIPVKKDLIRFDTPGQYEVILVCDDVELDPPIYIEART